MTLDVRVIAIADPDLVRGRDLVAAARAAEAGGATIIQLRMKHAGASAVLEAARRLRAALTVPLFVNDRADLAWMAGADGVHLGAEDIPAAAVRAGAPRPCLIGVSVGTAAEAAAARAADVDYWSIGSVFATATKPDAGLPIGTAGLRALGAQAPVGMPLVGIGGISAANAAEVVRAGAGGVAVISAIFGTRDIERAAREVRDAVDVALLARQR